MDVAALIVAVAALVAAAVANLRVPRTTPKPKPKPKPGRARPREALEPADGAEPLPPDRLILIGSAFVPDDDDSEPTPEPDPDVPFTVEELKKERAWVQP